MRKKVDFALIVKCKLAEAKDPTLYAECWGLWSRAMDLSKEGCGVASRREGVNLWHEAQDKWGIRRFPVSIFDARLYWYKLRKAAEDDSQTSDASVHSEARGLAAKIYVERRQCPHANAYSDESRDVWRQSP